jgi:hypothetical protein
LTCHNEPHKTKQLSFPLNRLERPSNFISFILITLTISDRTDLV